MSNNIPAELKYVASHEWLRLEDDGTITVGITHHAQELLGDIVYGAGWFFKIKPANPADYDGLLTAEQYAGEVD